MSDPYAAAPEDRFSFGLWTVGHRGGDPFGLPTRPPVEPETIVERLAEVGAWGVSLHDDDLVPFGSSPGERDRIVARFAEAVRGAGLCVPMTTVNLFTQPVFKDGALTAADPAVRRFALRKAVAAIDIGAELGRGSSCCGVAGRASSRARLVIRAWRWSATGRALIFSVSTCARRVSRRGSRSRQSRTSPRAHIYLPTTGHMLHFIETLAYPEMLGVNPEMAHESMAGLRSRSRSVRRCGRASCFTLISTPRMGRASTRTSASARRTSRKRS